MHRIINGIIFLCGISLLKFILSGLSIEYDRNILGGLKPLKPCSNSVNDRKLGKIQYLVFMNQLKLTNVYNKIEN